jgi:hypothetical protein
MDKIYLTEKTVYTDLETKTNLRTESEINTDTRKSVTSNKVGKETKSCKCVYVRVDEHVDCDWR